MNPITKEISALQNSPEDVYVVHFSHRITNTADHFYPRIVCIYVQNINGSESKKLSIEKLAKKQKVPIEEIADWYDELELILLDEFDEFLRSKTNCTFIYWAEDNQELILDVIKSRFEELNKMENRNFCFVPNGNRKSVHYLVSKIDSSAPRDLKLFIKQYNSQALVPGFLSLAEEQGFFDKKDFGKVGASVVAKVSFFVRVLNEFSNQVTTTSTISKITSGGDALDIRALKPMQLFSKLTFGSWMIIIGFIVGSFWGGWGFKDYLDKEELKYNLKEKVKAELDLELTTDSLKLQRQQHLNTISFLEKEKVFLQMQLKNISDSLVKNQH